MTSHTKKNEHTANKFKKSARLDRVISFVFQSTNQIRIFENEYEKIF